MKIRTLFRATVLPLLAAAILPLTATAEQPTPRVARADAFFELAVQMEQASVETGFNRHVRGTARLFMKSARLREISDPMRIESLYRAGKLLAQVQPYQSHRALAEAAELALIHGNVTRSAHAYLDAASLVQSGAVRSEEAQAATAQHVARARALADSPVLSVEQRDGILRRIGTGSVAMTR
jgi:hypothetical protein